jgi:hypothetical protein
MDGPVARKSSLFAILCIFCRLGRSTFNDVLDAGNQLEEESEDESEVCNALVASLLFFNYIFV